MTSSHDDDAPPGQVAVSTGQLDELCAHLDLDPPPVLAADPHDPPTSTDVVRDRRITGDVGHLARAPLAVDLQLPRHTGTTGTDAPDGAVAALDIRHGILAVRHGSRVTLRRLTPQQAIDAVVDLLGPLHPAPGPPARVPATVLTAALTAAGEDPHRLEIELMRRGMTTPCARALVDANRAVDAISRIGVTLRTPHGPRRGPYLLSVQHTPTGHHYQHPHRTPAGTDILHTAPATRDRITRELDELIRATADTAGSPARSRRSSPGPPAAGASI